MRFFYPAKIDGQWRRKDPLATGGRTAGLACFARGQNVQSIAVNSGEIARQRAGVYARDKLTGRSKYKYRLVTSCPTSFVYDRLAGIGDNENGKRRLSDDHMSIYQ